MLFSTTLKSIKTSGGHRFGTEVLSLTTNLTGVVIGITQCIAGCELLEIRCKDNNGVETSQVISSKMAKIINHDKVSEYEKIFAGMKITMPFKLGDEVKDRVTNVSGIIGELQFSVNSTPNLLMVKKYNEDDDGRFESARVASCEATGHSIHETIMKHRRMRENGDLVVKHMQKVRCIASGATGLVVAMFDQASGTISVGIQPISKKGKRLDVVYTDIELIEVIDDQTTEVIKPKTGLKKSGSLRSHELSSLQKSGITRV